MKNIPDCNKCKHSRWVMFQKLCAGQGGEPCVNAYNNSFCKKLYEEKDGYKESEKSKTCKTV